MSASGLFTAVLLLAVVTVEAGNSASKVDPTVNGFLIENKLTTTGSHSVGTPGALHVKLTAYQKDWVTISGKKATLENGNSMKMLDKDGSVEVALTMLNKENKIQVNQLPEGVAENEDTNPAKASTDTRLLQTSTWWLVNSINTLMSKFISEDCRVSDTHPMTVVWDDEENSQIAAMANIRDPEFPRLTVGRVPQDLVDGEAPHHSTADTHVVSHEYAHYFTSCMWRHHLSPGGDGNEGKAINEAISDVATLALRAQVLEDVEDPIEWLIGENLGVDVDGTQYLRKYYLSLDAAARASTELTGRDKLMLDNLSFDRYSERFDMDIPKVKDFYATGMIMATAWMKAIRNIYTVLRADTHSQSVAKKHYGRASQVVLQGIFAALGSTFKGPGKGKSDDAYFGSAVKQPIIVAETHGAHVGREYKWPGTFLHLRSCFIKKIKDVTEIASLSDAKKKEVQLAAWRAFADHGMGPGAYIMWKIESVEHTSFGDNLNLVKTFHGDTTVPSLDEVETGLSCDMPALDPDAHHNKEVELGEVSAPVRLRGQMQDEDSDTGLELKTLPEMD